MLWGGLLEVAGAETDVGSLQPNHPGLSQVGDVGNGREAEDDVVVGVVVIVGNGAAVAEVVVVGSLQPNQPGVLQVDVLVVVVDVEEVVVVVVAVVVLSRQPHQPGVSQVDVRVLVVVLDVEVEVVDSVPLLSKYFQLKQSTHSSSVRQVASSSYPNRTESMTT